MKENGCFNNYGFQDENKNFDLFSGLSSNLILITTEECNLRCKYCIYNECYSTKKTYSNKKMDKGIVIQAIDVLLKFHKEKLKRGYNDSIKIIFYGGEPLMNFQAVKNAVEYIQELGVKNVNYLLTTNGTVMTDEMIDYLAKNNFSLSFSLDGDEVNHNRNRVTVSGKETHSIVLQNLRKYSNKLTEYGLDIPINLMCCFDDYTDMIKATDFFIGLKKEIPQINVMYNRIYRCLSI